MRDPWYKSTLRSTALGASLSLDVPHDVFSTLRIDEGTSLLLENLPAGEPSAVLDMGCGYGALGLPIAARFPEAHVTMVDRDLLAARASAENARANHVAGVEAYGSLGFRDLRPEPSQYDWILCNVPARIGRPFVEYLVDGGLGRLRAGGQIRLVVIHDLAPLLIEIGKDRGWPLVEVVRGARHTVFSVGAEAAVQAGPVRAVPPEPRDLYLRDQVEVAGLTLDRPFDLGGDDPKRLASGLPVLLDALPRQAPAEPLRKILCFRCGYGPLPLVSRRRWPDTKVVAVDRDLLATAYTRRNAARQGLDGELLEVRESAHFPDVLGGEERFDLVMGELSPSAGEAVAVAEIQAVARSLSPSGQGFFLCLEKLDRDWVRPFVKRNGLRIHPIISRESYTVLRLVGP